MTMIKKSLLGAFEEERWILRWPQLILIWIACGVVGSCIGWLLVLNNVF